MAEPYIGQIEAFSFSYAPRGWVVCAGQILPISQYQALFALIGTTFGGNGTSNFQLPDLRSRLAMGQGNTAVMGATLGEENHTLATPEIPSHPHLLNAAVVSAPANNTDTPSNTVVLANGTGKPRTGPNFPVQLFAADANPHQPMSSAAIGNSPGGQPHTNLMPYLAVNFCISMQGLFPSRN